MIQIKFIEHLLHALEIQEGTRQAQVLPLTGQGSQAGPGGGVARQERARFSADATEGSRLIFWGIFQGLRIHLSAVPLRAWPPCWSQVCPDGWIFACSLERRGRKCIAPVSRVWKRNTWRGGNETPRGVMDLSILLYRRTSFSQPAPWSPHSLLSA